MATEGSYELINAARKWMKECDAMMKLYYWSIDPHVLAKYIHFQEKNEALEKYMSKEMFNKASLKDRLEHKVLESELILDIKKYAGDELDNEDSKFCSLITAAIKNKQWSSVIEPDEYVKGTDLFQSIEKFVKVHNTIFIKLLNREMSMWYNNYDWCKIILPEMIREKKKELFDIDEMLDNKKRELFDIEHAYNLIKQ